MNDDDLKKLLRLRICLYNCVTTDDVLFFLTILDSEAI